MKIIGFKIFTVEIPMRFAVSHTLAERKTARNILVRAQGDNGMTGWGESCPRPYLTGEDIEIARTSLSNDILPQLVGLSFCGFDDLADTLISMGHNLGRNRQAAFCGAELAVLDLAGKTLKRSVGTLIGPTAHRKVRYSGVIAASDPVKVKKYARLMRMFGFKEVKIKVQRSLETNLRLLTIARSVLGAGASIRIDANCAWSSDEAIEHIEAMAKFKLDGVEQPVSPDDLPGMTRITAAKLAPVVADESLCSLQDAETLIDRKACDIFNIRVSKCGGLLNSLAIYRKALDAGLSCQLGAQVGETAILSAAGRHIATRCASIKWSEGSYGNLLLKQDIARPGMTIGLGGWARSVDRPGLGVEPIERRIDAYTVYQSEVS